MATRKRSQGEINAATIGVGNCASSPSSPKRSTDERARILSEQFIRGNGAPAAE